MKNFVSSRNNGQSSELLVNANFLSDKGFKERGLVYNYATMLIIIHTHINFYMNPTMAVIKNIFAYLFLSASSANGKCNQTFLAITKIIQ